MFLSPSLFARQVCGIYLIEDDGDQEVRLLTDLNRAGGRQAHYTISNPRDPVVLGMVAGQCYCLSGPVKLDPGFAGDHDFHLIQVLQVYRGNVSPCGLRPGR